VTEDQTDPKNWRKIVLRTDGFNWIIVSNETNSSILEIKEICREVLDKYKKD
jgi:hypothetical protein